MTTFYLLRHGTRISRNEDTLLSEVGIKQAELTAQYLTDHNIFTISASPLARTQQTAQIITTQLELPISTDDRLLERMVYDETKGDTFEQFLTEWNRTTLDRMYQPPYGDSSYASGERVKRVLDEVSDDGIHLIVTHGGAIGDVLRNIFSDDALSFQTSPDGSLKWVEISECSISEIVKDGDSYLLKRVNDTSHLI